MGCTGSTATCGTQCPKRNGKTALGKEHVLPALCREMSTEDVPIKHWQQSRVRSCLSQLLSALCHEGGWERADETVAV